MVARDGFHRVGVGQSADLAAGAGQGEERDESDSLFTAGSQHRVVDPAVVDAVPVLYCDHGRDLLSLRKVLHTNIRQPQMPNQAGLAEFSQYSEVLGDRLESGLAQVDQVQAVQPELAQIVLDQAAKLTRLGEAGFGRADLCGDLQVARVGGEGLPDGVVAQLGRLNRASRRGARTSDRRRPCRCG
jgi:hypothetical protein